MAQVTIRVRTEGGGDVEVEEYTSTRTFGGSDTAHVGRLLDQANAKIRAAYGIEPPPATPTGRADDGRL
jgi:hypothetical protein